MSNNVHEIHSGIATIVDVLRAHAKAREFKTAFTFVDSDVKRTSITYRELDERASRIAHGLLQNADPGDRAMMIYQPGLEFIEAFLGCLYAGIIAVPAYPPRKNRKAEMTLSIAENCSPRLLLCSSVTQAYLNRHRQTSLFDASLLVTDQMRSSVIDLPSPTSTDIAFLQYTSGSTGCPKGVKVTHANLIANQHSIANAFEHTNASIVVSWLPTFHDMGLVGATLQPLFVGCPAIHIAPEVFVRDPLKWLALISNEKATTSGAPNFAYDYCVDRIPDRELDALDLSTWKVAFNGAEPVRAATTDRFMAKFRRCGFEPTSFLPCYGMAESTLFVSGGPAGTWSQKRSPNENRDMPGTDVCQAQNRDSTKVVSCGVIATNTSIKIIHASGAELQEGSVGEIWISGPSVCDGYWDVELATCRTFNQILEEGTGDRWLRTGDLGFIQDNELFVTGRVKDLIVIRGRNIHAEDIERLARDTFDLQALQGVVAFEHPDFDRPGIVVAVESLTVQTQLADQMFEDLSQAIAESHGASLRSLLSVRRASLPKTTSGKIRRKAAQSLFRVGELRVQICVDRNFGGQSI